MIRSAGGGMKVMDEGGCGQMRYVATFMLHHALSRLISNWRSLRVDHTSIGERDDSGEDLCESLT